MEKLKQILDSRATWAVIGSVAGSVFGEKALAIVTAVGNLVMAVI